MIIEQMKSDADNSYYSNSNNNNNNNNNLEDLFVIIINFVTPFYIVLSIIALASRKISFLATISSHGKTITRATTSITTLNNFYIQQYFWVPKRYFLHFYIVGITCLILYLLLPFFKVSSILSSILSSVLSSYDNNNNNDSDNDDVAEAAAAAAVVVVLSVVEATLALHLIRRIYECLKVHNMFEQQQKQKETSKMHIAGYLLGIIHYIILPFALVGRSSSSLTTAANYEEYSTTTTAADNNNHNIHIDNNIIFVLSSTSVRQSILVLFNLWFQYEQYQHHYILAQLRRQGKGHGQQSSSSISSSISSSYYYSLPPPKRWFKFVLCPHYLAEILIYLTWALMIQQQQQQQQQQRNYHQLVDNDDVGSDTNNNNNKLLLLLLLDIGKHQRHWFLFLWVATNLTVSTWNNYDWYNNNKKKKKKKKL